MSGADGQPRRALLSVSDKTGIAEFAHALLDLGLEIVSTGGTRRALLEGGVAATEVATVTGFPEIMDGRVKTLHPMIHGGILARRDIDAEAMAHHEIAAIDVVAVNLYPFQETVAKPDCTMELALDNVDIGGPAMLRAAAKNHPHVLAVADPMDYAETAQRLRDDEADIAFRRHLAAKAFAHTAAYDAAVARYLEAHS